MKYRSSSNIVFSCRYHIIFYPKYRRKVLIGEVEARLKEIVNEVAKALMVDIIEMETDKDYIYILAGVHPQLGVNTFVKKVKGRSSRLLRAEFPSLKTRLPTLWTNSYFVSTVGGAPLETIKQYIENQQLSERENDRSRWSHYMDSVNHG